MRLFREKAPAGSGAVVYAIGNFDGLHPGHLAVIETAKTIAKEQNLPCGLISFEPHPRQFFAKQQASAAQESAQFVRLTPFAVKTRLLEGMGLDFFVPLRFDKALAALSPEQFVRDWLKERLCARHLVAGENFRFGKDRAGDMGFLQQIGASLGLEVHIQPPVQREGQAFSSTLVRRALAEGKVEEAASWLGRWWEIAGIIRRGDARGRQLGFPTANLPAEPVARLGVYAVWAALGRKTGLQTADLIAGVANLGKRPSFDGEQILLETHLIKKDGDFYGDYLRVWPVQFLRPEQKFASFEALSSQIMADKEKATALLGKAPPPPPPFPFLA